MKLEEMNSSKFAVWRALIAIAYSDHELDKKEKMFLYDKIVDLPFTEEQRAQLDQDIENGVKLDDVYDQIEGKNDHAHLMNMAYVLFHKDDVFCDNERDVYQELKDHHMGRVDHDEALKDARESADLYFKEWKQEQKADRKNSGLLETLFDYLIS